ncbi:bifunctional UDP-N-acetylglucosamine diphosphorylase/glucosamine-1-phosphate N-acetyltransferase GlmU [Alkalicoccobacillus gibsonii]|uniref:bifunctional UDP-N-acetylglucosamine diphosphorylase/glucosamine-1-phosphate N-acetyltransferase GlmU n=1 Tax=Alkalicoccobacillus gibsonii TaxID=79881 RepID=UPI00193200EC|nr:bifunctional UDP-N-acetylglucosamine diphosphorylase/glucosamine-1-phosphate N-acetyltransferase GlmU [Alkalicoccobacillus gibsonii]MBM0067795.1 bifunctional UDP-N-acetylglucosamine diphosphorylase/glucosamine-1-phosphate N-acetyltransferase GlmU [Alkalicoccobacillus gibsonii]
MTNRYAVILAAGQGTRMKSKLYKVLHPVCGKPMVQHVSDALNQVGFDETVIVVGHGAEAVKAQLGEEFHYVLQAEQLGTGHAVLQADELLKDKKGITVVLAGDTPLLTGETIDALIAEHQAKQAKITVLTALAEDPTGYGRVIRGANGLVERVVEHKDATAEEQKVREINTSTYCFDNELLFQALKQVGNENAQGEYYLPDVIEILQKQGEVIAAYQSPTFSETFGVNDRVALSEAESIMKKRINERWMRAGVTMIDPAQTYISSEATIGQDTVIYPGASIQGTSVIGSECVIGANSEIRNSVIADFVEVKQSVIHDSKVESRVTIGPFAHIRPGSALGEDVRIGNFVEVKKSSLAKGSKAAHLSYVGDAEVGQNVNLGCGTITVNYDGENKYKTTIADGAFIGSNSNLVAPVHIGENALVAAGSTITEDVPHQALSIARARQVNKENYKKSN